MDSRLNEGRPAPFEQSSAAIPQFQHPYSSAPGQVNFPTPAPFNPGHFPAPHPYDAQNAGNQYGEAFQPPLQIQRYVPLAPAIPPAKRNVLRACDICRRDKQRCDRQSVEETCARCKSRGFECYTTPSAVRRGPARGHKDLQIAELQRQLSDTQARASLLTQRRGSGGTEASFETTPDLQTSVAYDDSVGIQQERPQKRRRLDFPEHHSNAVVQYHRERVPDHVPNSFSDVNEDTRTSSKDTSSIRPSSYARYQNNEIIRPGHERTDGILRKHLNIETVSSLVSHFLNNMLVHLPVLDLRLHGGLSEFRQAKPVLFLAILTVAAGQEHPELQRVLLGEMARMYAEKIVCRSEKSLEIVQAILVSAAWYPMSPRDERPLQLINMATTMATALGLRKKNHTIIGFPLTIVTNGYGDLTTRLDPTTVESRRTWLSCYLLSSNIAIGLRQPNMLPWDGSLQNCVESLEISEEAVPSDVVLCQWAKLQIVADQVALQIQHSSERGQYGAEIQVEDFHQRLDRLRIRFSEKQISLPLGLAFYAVKLQIHELAMRQQSEAQTKRDTAATPAISWEDYLSSIHSVLNGVLTIPPTRLQVFPMFLLARAGYACISLVRLYCTRVSSDEEANQDENLHVGLYLDRVLEHLQSGSSNRQTSHARVIIHMLSLLRQWLQRADEMKCADKDRKLHEDFGLDPAEMETEEGYDNALHSRLPAQANSNPPSDNQSLRGQNQACNDALSPLSQAATSNPNATSPQQNVLSSSDRLWSNEQDSRLNQSPNSEVPDINAQLDQGIGKALGGGWDTFDVFVEELFQLPLPDSGTLNQWS